MLIHSDDEKSFKWHAELVQELFYHDSPEKDLIFAKAHLSWQAFSALTTPVQLRDTVYIHREAADSVVAEIKSLRQKAFAFQRDTSSVKTFDKFLNN